MANEADGPQIDSESAARDSPQAAPGLDGWNTNSSSTETAPDTSATSDATDPAMDSTDLVGLDELERCVDSMTAFDAPIKSFAFPELGQLDHRQLNYVVSQFKNSISSFVADNQSLFIHPLLYQDTIPEVYQDALGVCSLVGEPRPSSSLFYQVSDCML